MFKNFISNKLNIGLVAIIILLIGAGFFAYQKFIASKTIAQPLEVVDLVFDPEGSYALMFPRADGNALNLTVKRIASYEAFSYVVSYTDETGIDRGAGDLNTWIDLKNKSEYDQEILFGTCSKGATQDPLHCVFDKGVENGTLTLEIKKGTVAYKMISQWHLQKPDVALGKLTSGDGHLTYQIDTNASNLALIPYSIVSDLSGAPKLPADRTIVGKVYSVNGPVAKTMPGGQLTIELAEAPPSGSKIARFDDTESKWVEMDTKIDGSKLTAKSETAGIVTVLAPQAPKK